MHFCSNLLLAFISNTNPNPNSYFLSFTAKCFPENKSFLPQKKHLVLILWDVLPAYLRTSAATPPIPQHLPRHCLTSVATCSQMPSGLLCQCCRSQQEAVSCIVSWHDNAILVQQAMWHYASCSTGATSLFSILLWMWLQAVASRAAAQQVLVCERPTAAVLR